MTGHSGDHLIAIHDTATVSASARLLGKSRSILHEVHDFYWGLNSDGTIRDFVKCRLTWCDERWNSVIENLVFQSSIFFFFFLEFFVLQFLNFSNDLFTFLSFFNR